MPDGAVPVPAHASLTSIRAPRTRKPRAHRRGAAAQGGAAQAAAALLTRAFALVLVSHDATTASHLEALAALVRSVVLGAVQHRRVSIADACAAIGIASTSIYAARGGGGDHEAAIHALPSTPCSRLAIAFSSPRTLQCSESYAGAIVDFCSNTGHRLPVAARDAIGELLYALPVPLARENEAMAAIEDLSALVKGAA